MLYFVQAFTECDNSIFFSIEADSSEDALHTSRNAIPLIENNNVIVCTLTASETTFFGNVDNYPLINVNKFDQYVTGDVFDATGKIELTL